MNTAGDFEVHTLFVIELYLCFSFEIFKKAFLKCSGSSVTETTSRKLDCESDTVQWLFLCKSGRSR